MVLLAPSILSADFSRLGEQVGQVEQAGADLLHLDIMDGHFVPNLTFGPVVVRSLRPATKLPFYAHLMVDSPEWLLAPLAGAGVQTIVVHPEACRHLHRVVAQIHDLGCRAGVALNPSTPLGTLEEILPDLDTVLLLAVNPGFGGQQFIAGTVDKIARLRRMLADRGLGRVDVAVDGGIDEHTAPLVVRAGVTILVAGAAIFAASDGPAAALRRLRAAVATADGR